MVNLRVEKRKYEIEKVRREEGKLTCSAWAYPRSL
jgi:hypothetical protein